MIKVGFCETCQQNMPKRYRLRQCCYKIVPPATGKRSQNLPTLPDRPGFWQQEVHLNGMSWQMRHYSNKLCLKIVRPKADFHSIPGVETPGGSRHHCSRTGTPQCRQQAKDPAQVPKKAQLFLEALWFGGVS